MAEEFNADWQFLEDLKALENAADPSILEGDIVESLRIDEKKISQELEMQPARAYQWAVLAIRITKIVNLFEHTILRRYEAHIHGFGSLYLKATGVRDSQDARKEAAIKLFDKDAEDYIKRQNSEDCMKGKLLATMTQSSLQKHITDEGNTWKEEVDEMFDQMYGTELISYDDMIRRYEAYKEKKEVAQAIAECFRQRGYAVSNIAELIRTSNFGEGMRVRGYANKLNEKQVSALMHAWSNNPKASPQLIAEMVNSKLEADGGQSEG